MLDNDGEAVFQFYETQACHSYHTTGDGLKVASIPTTLAFFLALVYSGETTDETSRLLCVAQRLMELAADKPDRMFSLLTPTTCLGKQKELIDLRRERVGLYTKMKDKKDSPDFVQYFFTYSPSGTKTERAKAKKVLKKTRKERLSGKV